MTITDPRLARETTHVPRRSDYEKRPRAQRNHSPRHQAYHCVHVKTNRNDGQPGC